MWQIAIPSKIKNETNIIAAEKDPLKQKAIFQRAAEDGMRVIKYSSGCAFIPFFFLLKKY